MKKFLKSIPGYGWLATIGWLVLNCSVYFGTRLLPHDAVYHAVALPLDSRIPLVPVMIVPYVLSYPFWGLNYLLIGREDRNTVWRFFTGAYIAKLVCLVCFLAYPTQIVRPYPTVGDVFSALTRLIYRLDAPNNLFPSIHCLECWLGVRGIAQIERIPKSYKIFALIFSLIVFASTVLVRQHYLLDIPAGILTAEFGIAASRLIWKKRGAK